jgi:hypothetical protein
MKKRVLILIITFTLLLGICFIGYYLVPINRVGITSELIMLGDLNNDKKWNHSDKLLLDNILKNPYLSSRLTHFKIDFNQNQLIDSEDLAFLYKIYKYSDPYIAYDTEAFNKRVFPRPRELFRYIPKYEYIQRPILEIEHSVIQESPFLFLKNRDLEAYENSYQKKLFQEIYDEAIRASLAYQIRKPFLNKIEIEFKKQKVAYCHALFQNKKYFELLLVLMALTEDAETITNSTQTIFVQKILFFREHLKDLLVSEKFKSYKLGKISYKDIYKIIESYLLKDLNIQLDLDDLENPRDFLDLENYTARAKWQKHKSSAKKESFRKLILFAQYDRRYLRAVSKTTQKHKDIRLVNHNLPMILLFREALSIMNGDKKAAVGLLDESFRIPMGWVKSIPKKLLPSSVALENFLLPGNKEDGSDKSRHWNVFGGLSLYKSPQESLILALKRENLDLVKYNFTYNAMQEFIRDMIANINGIYWVESINLNLLEEYQKTAKR